MTDPGPASGKPRETLRKRFLAEEQQGIDAMARWLGHPAVPGIIQRRRLGAETVVAPIARLLTCQIEVIRFLWRAYGIAGIEPNWEIRHGKPWMLTMGQLSVIERVEADLRGVIQLAVNELVGAGVGLVPSWTSDHIVVGELLLLEADWCKPPRELASDLQPPGIGAIHIDASGTSHRRGSGERANNNVGALRGAYEAHLYGAPPRAPYAGGGTRALPAQTQRRRQALAKVLEQWPNATASQIHTSFGNREVRRGGLARSPGGYLRQLLEQDAEFGDQVLRPSKSTIHEDLKAIRAIAERQKPSS